LASLRGSEGDGEQDGLVKFWVKQVGEEWQVFNDAQGEPRTMCSRFWPEKYRGTKGKMELAADALQKDWDRREREMITKRKEK